MDQEDTDTGTSTSASAIQTAVIGGGNWGRNVVRTLHELGALVAVADSSEGVRDALRHDYPTVTVFDDYRDMLHMRREIDALAIASPAPLHYEMARAGLEAGLDVFVEKPMTLTTEHARELANLAEERDRVLMAGHLLLYQPAVRFLQDYLNAGKLGHVYTFHVERMKLGRARQVENVLWSFGVHDVAVLLALAGSSPREISVTGHCGLQPGVEDDVYLHLTMPDGVKAHLHNSWLWPETRRRTVVTGSEGIVVYDEVKQRVILHKKGIDPQTLHNQDDGQEELFQGEAQPLTLEMREFLDCVRERRLPRSSGQSAVEVVRVLEQAEKMLQQAREPQ
jgi:predicted dehydrogenase